MKIAPSLLAADFTCLRTEVEKTEAGGADLLHLDVMDGHFVPNITFGPIVVKAVRKLTQLKLDVHLMIKQPARYLEDFAADGADSITVHAEVCPDLPGIIGQIRTQQVCVGVSLNPDTPVDVLKPVLEQLDLVLVMSVNPGFGGQTFIPSCLEKIRQVRQWIDQAGLKTEIEIDGGIRPQTASEAKQAGVDILVAGSAIFGSGDVAENIRALRNS
ncbi:MAG: ribulose-phosphate 3-epimerase [Candidatus Latescibacteria bacterium]|nr:ribulose-phosphate 3-epimerase [Candidatus Latescibacterota bacterium]